MPRAGDLADRHRAVYTLERSVWRARCRICSFETAAPARREAADLFRQHIRATRLETALTNPSVIDLREATPLAKSERV